MSDLLERYTHGDYRATKRRMDGTEDWVEVGRLGTDGGYDWSDFNVFYSPSARRYFWHGDSGCSCNSWSDGVSSVGDFENGDREAVLRAWERFADGNHVGVGDFLDGASKVRNFVEPITAE